jgi:hypothetical protein
MAVTGHIFPQFIIGMNAGNIVLGSGTVKIGLSNAAGPIGLATSGVSTATLWTDWKTNVAAEITGTGYTAGGVTVASPTFTAGGSNNSVATFTSATNPSWTSATITANQAVMYQSSATTNQLIAFWDFGGAVSVSNATLTLTINSSGLMTATVS